MAEDFNKRKHQVNIVDREMIELSGVRDVPAFNEEVVSVQTDYGDIVIRGNDMKLEALDLDTGEVKIAGRITAVIYNDKLQAKGIFKRTFSS